MIEGHGDDIYRYGGKVKYNFSSNICASACLGEVMQYLANLPELPGSYPEPYPASLEAKIAEMEGVAPENVMVTNGATEAIYLVAHAMTGSVSAIVSPTFSEYEDACRLYHHTVRHVNCLSALPADADVIWLCNPNNPTGKVTPISELRSLVALNHGRLCVIDQAYADYTLCRVLDAREAVNSGNIILLGSFTKRYSVPGLRVGYAIGNARLLDLVRACRMPWSVSNIAISAAHFLMSMGGRAASIDAGALHIEALRLSDALRDAGIEVADTDCNFILCRLPGSRSACELKEWLVDNHGMLIRDASNFHGLGAQHFRVAVQSPEADDLLVNAIKEWM